MFSDLLLPALGPDTEHDLRGKPTPGSDPPTSRNPVPQAATQGGSVEGSVPFRCQHPRDHLGGLLPNVRTSLTAAHLPQRAPGSGRRCRPFSHLLLCPPLTSPLWPGKAGSRGSESWDPQPYSAVWGGG